VLGLTVLVMNFFIL